MARTRVFRTASTQSLTRRASGMSLGQAGYVNPHSLTVSGRCTSLVLCALQPGANGGWSASPTQLPNPPVVRWLTARLWLRHSEAAASALR